MVELAFLKFFCLAPSLTPIIPAPRLPDLLFTHPPYGLIFVRRAILALTHARIRREQFCPVIF